jgi:subtilisin family serine protease
VPEGAKKKGPPPEVVSRDDQYLIAPVAAGLLPAGVEPVNLDTLTQSFEADPAIDLVKTIEPHGMVTAMSADAPGAQKILVAKMPEGHAERLQGAANLIVERDIPLFSQDLLPEPVPPVPRNIGTFTPFGAELKVTVVVQGADGKPIAEAKTYLFGRLGQVYQGATNKSGKVTFALFGEEPDTLVGLYVDPLSEYWSVYIQRPLLNEGEEHLVTLAPLSEQYPGFPQTEMLGWGPKAMKVDQLPPNYRGKGARVGVIDSGVAGGHIDLGQVRGGFDLTSEPPSPVTWNTDTLGHGSHCCGVIAASVNQQGIIGVAPEAEVHMYKIFPGGRASSLIEALQHAIDDQVDVVNLSLGSDEFSELVEHKIGLAKEMGVACVVAAGNSNGPVQFPGKLRQVLAVSAIGKQGEYPTSSYQATEAWAGGKVSPEGYFSAKFTCFGPEVAVCAPGVAIVSSVPADNWTVMDGTSMATPHVTGLAALLLAHHPDFKGEFSARNFERVDRLFAIIKACAEPLDLGDPERTGAGLPNAVKAFGPGVATMAPAEAPPQAAAASPALAQLGQLIEAAHLKAPGAASAAVSPAAARPVAAASAVPAAATPAAPAAARPTAPAAATPAASAGPFGQLREMMEGARLVTPEGAPPTASAAAPVAGSEQNLEALRELMAHAGI